MAALQKRQTVKSEHPDSSWDCSKEPPWSSATLGAGRSTDRWHSASLMSTQESMWCSGIEGLLSYHAGGLWWKAPSKVWRSIYLPSFYCPDISLLVLMPLSVTVQTSVHELSLHSPESGPVADLSISWLIWQKLYTQPYSPTALKIFERTKKRWSTALLCPMR